jgi:hypothetical protein
MAWWIRRNSGKIYFSPGGELADSRPAARR